MKLNDLFEADVVDLGQHKMNKAMGGYVDAMRDVFKSEADFFKSGKFLPFAQAYIDSGFKEDFRPKYAVLVEFRDYRTNSTTKALLEQLKKDRFKIQRNKYHKDFQGTKEGPWAMKEDVPFEQIRKLFAERHHSPYGVYQRSQSGFRTSTEKVYDENGVGFTISVLGVDPRRGDKYGRPHREEDHVIDDEKDFKEVVEMEAAINRARMKAVP